MSTRQLGYGTNGYKRRTRKVTMEIIVTAAEFKKTLDDVRNRIISIQNRTGSK